MTVAGARSGVNANRRAARQVVPPYGKINIDGRDARRSESALPEWTLDSAPAFETFHPQHSVREIQRIAAHILKRSGETNHGSRR